MDKKRKNDYYSVSILICLLLIFTSNFYSLFISDENIIFMLNVILRLIFIFVFIKYTKKNNLEIPCFSKLKFKHLLFIPFIFAAFSNTFVALAQNNNISFKFDIDLIIKPIVLSILTAFLEEIVFRGVLVKELLKDTSKFKTILISSLIFGGMHLLNISSLGSIPVCMMQAIYTFGLGLIFAFIYVYSNNILLSFILHFFFNFFNGDLIDLYIFVDFDLKYILVNALVGIIVGIYGLLIYKFIFNKEDLKDASKHLDL